jgi:hypothetical protein
VARRAASPAPVVTRAAAPTVINLTPSVGGGSSSAQGSTGGGAAGSTSSTSTSGGGASSSAGSSGGPTGASIGAGALTLPGGSGQGGTPSTASQQTSPQVEINGVVYRTTADHLRDPALFEYSQCVQIGRITLFLPPWLAAWIVNHVRFAHYCST